MAIRTSNQITFTEHKKIKEIKEWYLATSKSSGVTSNQSEGWTTTVQTINKTKKYLWNYEEVVYSIGSSDISDPVIIGVYSQGADGAAGKGISSIKNYYLITQTTTLPSSPQWLTAVGTLTPKNKYLWNYEQINYTDDTSDNTEPAIIGVYGDSGTDAVDFQIYSVNGFEFTDTLKSIELKTIAFQAGSAIAESKLKYQWKWWNKETNTYNTISGATYSTFTVNSTDEYSLTSLKCEMTYDGIVYEDYVSLTNKTIVYTAIVKFFDGNNIITTEEEYLIAYVELYKDNQPEELLYADKVYRSDTNSVSNNIITTDITGTYSNGDMMYFVYKNASNEYDVVLGTYKSSQWNVTASNYKYKNDMFEHVTSPVIFIPKEKVSRSLNINFEIYNSDNSVVARTNTIVLDFNDPSVSSSPPDDPKEGQLWLDTSVSPSILKMWDGNKWVNSGYQNGNVVYTSKPTKGYSKGDLWILADGEKCGDFTTGSMLRANATSTTFNDAHWEDVDEEATEQKKNIKQYFLFNKDTGLRIGQADDKFYVNISSTEMGFYDASDGTAKKVVSIGNKSATIKNLTVEENAIFKCEVQFGEFILKTESNGSLSLALST